MKPLYSNVEFELAKPNENLQLVCYQCNEPFNKSKHAIQRVLLPHSNSKGMFCSKRCECKFMSKTQPIECTNCGIKVEKKLSQIKKTKSGNHFCTKSCATTYNNKNKAHGTRRSKLEVWLEQELPSLYPNLEFHFNRKDAINSELDIYIPSLHLAFELNGIFHYEPIYGPNKLGQIQSNDISKSKACIDNQIDLCVIDVSGFNHFKPLKAQKYLNIITRILQNRLDSSKVFQE